jgi:hypothetical protein
MLEKFTIKGDSYKYIAFAIPDFVKYFCSFVKRELIHKNEFYVGYLNDDNKLTNLEIYRQCCWETEKVGFSNKKREVNAYEGVGHVYLLGDVENWEKLAENIEKLFRIWWTEVPRRESKEGD